MMREYLTEAIVLGHEDSNEFDCRIDLYTKESGRLRAKAVSAKKTGSKLIGHLQPLTLSRIRLVEKNGFLVADALIVDRFESIRQSPESFGAGLKLLDFLKAHVFEGEPDPGLWQWLKTALSTGIISYDWLIGRLGAEIEISESPFSRS